MLESVGSLASLWSSKETPRCSQESFLDDFGAFFRYVFGPVGHQILSLAVQMVTSGVILRDLVSECFSVRVGALWEAP